MTTPAMDDHTPSSLTIPRRHAVLGLSGLLAAAALSRVPADRAFAAQPAVPGGRNPFTLGVAAGEPTHHSMLLWTRLAPEPLAPDGGMAARPVGVEWQVSTDENFGRIDKSGTAWAAPELAHSVHADVNGLRPGHDYFYRFRHAGVISPVGRFRTTPPPGARVDRMRIAFASCQAWQDGYYGALAQLATEDADLHVHLGDYVYEGGIPADGGHRATEVPSLLGRAPDTDITRWRQQYAWYKSDPDLQTAHRAGAWMVTWDDHEVLNDYANTTSQYAGYSDISVRRRAAYQAWYEHQPVRLRTSAGFTSPVIYRRLNWGRLVQFDLIDGRQYRNAPPCGWGEADACAPAADPSITMLGTEQENWLARGYRASNARWNLLGSNVMLSRLDHDGDAGDRLWNDAWDGFPAARARLLESWRRAGLRNPVTFTGDWHSTFVNEVHSDFDRPDSPVVGAEFVGTSISTNGDGDVYGPYYGPMIKYNPHIKFFDGDRRGYQLATVARDALRVDLRMVDSVATRTPNAYTHASFEVADGLPGVHRL